MKKYIEIPAEALENLENGRYVEGSLHRCKLTGKIVFRAYNRLSRKKRDRIIRQLENGWLKESATRIKFYNSVKKDLGFRLVNVAMHRDLKDAMSTLEVRDLISRV
jgi:hypothetical protein